MKRHLALLLFATNSVALVGCATHAKPEPEQRVDADAAHVVVRGESLWDISKKSGVSLTRLIELNPRLKNQKPLEVGETLRLRE
jgi:LysM repeat protein